VLTLYNLFVTIYYWAVRIVSVWNTKAKEWITGRNHWTDKLIRDIDYSSPWIWVHCASAGEFEQGKPLIEKLKQTYIHHKILVSFFSPSGYQAGKKYKQADAICYLPLDTPGNATQFLNIVRPQLAIFIKYDYWYHHLKAVADRKIPLLLVSAIFRDNQPFFKWYGSLHRQMLSYFTHIFVQDDSSKERLQSISISHATVSGDTRFDRVATIASNHFSELAHIKEFLNDSKVLVAGSTWPEDEEMIKESLVNLEGIKTIIAPHEINAAHISNLLKLFPNAVKYSEAGSQDLSQAPVLIIDNVGMLSRLYFYADITYIGGGFNKSGIHNTLEAAVWGKPVLFGPNYQKFKEARDLIQRKAAFSLSNAASLNSILKELLENKEAMEKSSLSAQDYVQEQKGATNKILSYIQANRLLTN
jgi:3-deoxy-D-manno-octulosonic-acid transferase